MSGLFSSEGDNPPPFMQDKKKPEEPAKSETPVEPIPKTKPAEKVVEESAAEAKAAVERSSKATSKALKPIPHPLAKQLYEMYCELVGGKAFNGDPLPNWEDFSSHIDKQVQAQAWVAIADFAANKGTGAADYSAAAIAKHATFEDIMKAGQIRAKDDKVQMILSKATSAYNELIEKVSEDVARRAIGKLYMEAIEGRLIAADAAQRNPS